MDRPTPRTDAFGCWMEARGQKVCADWCGNDAQCPSTFFEQWRPTIDEAVAGYRRAYGSDHYSGAFERQCDAFKHGYVYGLRAAERERNELEQTVARLRADAERLRARDVALMTDHELREILKARAALKKEPG